METRNVLGIAWDSGDQFTFKIWTELDWKWNDRTELVRNVVRFRKKRLIFREETTTKITDDAFKLQKQVFNRKQKQCSKTVYN